MPVKALLVAAAVCLLIGSRAAVAAPAATDPSAVARATLDNGLRIIAVRNTLAPVVATALNYDVGSDESPAGFPGTAHALEHMMFRGNPALSAEQLADIGTLLGGNFNANTRESLTQYVFTVPAEDLGVVLSIEAARMQGILATKDSWTKERGAIEQEVAADFSEPFEVLHTRLRARMFAATPYEHDALGTRPSFDKTSAAMLADFYGHWYAPNNALLVMVGDIEPEAAIAKAREVFGSIPRKSLPPRPAVELRPLKPERVTMPSDQSDAASVVALRAPGTDSPDYAAFEVLCDVLASHRFDLYGLAAAGKAVDASFEIEPMPKAGLAWSVVTFPAGGDAAGIERDVRTILQRVARDGVPAELVAAAKLQERREGEFAKNSIADLASVWSDAVELYGLSSPDEDIERIDKVSVEDVNRVARKYLDVDHSIHALLVPSKSGAPVIASGKVGGKETIDLGEAPATKLPGWAENLLHHLDVPASTLHPVVSTLANGVTLIVQQEDISDTVSVYGRVRSRAEVEVAQGKEGVAELLDDLFEYGTDKRDRLSLESALDELGATEKAGTDFSIRLLSSDFERGVDLLAEHELHPALPQPDFERLRERATRTVAARNASPGFLNQHALRHALFPETDPLQRHSTPQTVQALTIDDVRDYYRTTIRPDLATIVVVGKVTPEEASRVITKSFGSWSASGPRPDVDLPPAPQNAPGQASVPDASRVQDEVTLAQTLDMARSNPEYYALELGNRVLGGGFYSSRLSVDLRKNGGLVYDVGSHIQAGRTRSVYIAHYACDAANVSTAGDLIVRDLRQMQNSPVSDDELARAKSLVLRQIPLADASIEALAHGLLQRRDLDLPLDEPTVAARRYVALTPEDVRAAFAKWMRPGDLVRVTQGPAPH
ncbi:MAG TPA: pitrilysin family protein [Candidatus Binatia bacterium]